MKNIAGLMKQASQMQAKMAEMQAKVEAMETEGQSGAGMVVVTLSGKGDLRRVKIDPKLADPAETGDAGGSAGFGACRCEAQAGCDDGGRDVQSDGRNAAPGRDETAILEIACECATAVIQRGFPALRCSRARARSAPVLVRPRWTGT